MLDCSCLAEPAKDCVRRMLVRDPKRRATAQQILQHDWMRENGVAADTVIELEVLTRIRKFSAMNRLKKEALKVGARGRTLRSHVCGRPAFLSVFRQEEAQGTGRDKLGCGKRGSVILGRLGDDVGN